jgi:hypothetical protein
MAGPDRDSGKSYIVVFAREICHPGARTWMRLHIAEFAKHSMPFRGVGLLNFATAVTKVGR